MASLVATDFYLQTLAKKICTQELREPLKRTFGVPGSKLRDDSAQPRKKKKKKKERNQKNKNKVGASRSEFSQVSPAKPAGSNVKKSVTSITPGTNAEERNGKDTSVTPGVTGSKKAPATNFAMDFLRQRLHNKIEEISGKASTQALSPSVLEKRQRRKYERERKKRRRKEFRMKEKLEKETAEEASSTVVSETQQAESKPDILFNNVEVGAEEEPNKVKKKEDKRKSIKGNITPLTGKNYKQLLNRLESRKTKLEELKAKDEEKAKELEAKMQWTNVLYKAEGVKIRDDEEKLKAALKRKEKRKAQRQRKWEKRTEQVVERMQQRQEKRRKNIQQKKLARIEKKKAKARKKGRILPEDLKKAGPK
ncbi:surfeit locus protein 6 [Notechis scutatus]|uniref:Surfeit locus protein 6 n=1 Tax=Notechis scutatus TaxID=8663 RepID=A0A6J1VRC3_9SAUR|nr:surfeit locus protein 6 [Notechis scutatus]XP_026542504.1 surfeit locus protein 6 [Notechis scutatus]